MNCGLGHMPGEQLLPANTTGKIFKTTLDGHWSAIYGTFDQKAKLNIYKKFINIIQNVYMHVKTWNPLRQCQLCFPNIMQTP